MNEFKPEIPLSSPIDQQHPSVHEGVFYFPEFEVPDSVVKRYAPDIENPSFHSSGQVHTDGVVMTDGHSYSVVRGVPHEPRTDITVAMTTAWLTSPRGHNRHTVEHFMRLGIPITSVGAEGSYRPEGGRFSRKALSRLANISLATSAHNFHEILDVTENEHSGLESTTANVVLLGESRGGMVGKGIIAFADHHDRNVVYSDLTAPCFPDKLSVGDIPEMSKQLLSEPVQLVNLMGSLTVRKLIHYPPTIDLHPVAIAHNIATIPTLLGGQAGDLGLRVPENHNMHITTFDDDIVSNPGRWEEIYAGHPNVRIKRIDGAHLTIAHPSTMAYIESRLFSLLAEVERVGSKDPADLDFSSVHLHDGDTPLAT